MKKVWKVLLILFLAATWLNVGYWGGQSWLDANNAKFYNDKPLNGFQKFQFGGWKFFQRQDDNLVDLQKEWGTITLIATLGGPLGLIISLSTWIIYGIMCAAVGFWHGLVFLGAFLWNFFFCGGFFKLLGATDYHWVLVGISLIVGISLAWWGWKLGKRNADISMGMLLVLVSTIFCVLFLILYGTNYYSGSWLALYIVWNIFLFFSLIANIFKQ